MATLHYMDVDRAYRANTVLQLKGFDAELLPNLQQGEDVFHVLKLNSENEQNALDHLRRLDLLGDLDNQA